MSEGRPSTLRTSLPEDPVSVLPREPFATSEDRRLVVGKASSWSGGQAGRPPFNRVAANFPSPRSGAYCIVLKVSPPPTQLQFWAGGNYSGGGKQSKRACGFLEEAIAVPLKAKWGVRAPPKSNPLEKKQGGGAIPYYTARLPEKELYFYFYTLTALTPTSHRISSTTA